MSEAQQLDPTKWRVIVTTERGALSVVERSTFLLHPNGALEVRGIDFVQTHAPGTWRDVTMKPQTGAPSDG